MNISMKKRSLLRGASVMAAALLAASTALVPSASADPGSNLVAFGDSYFANPTPMEYANAKVADVAAPMSSQLPPEAQAQLGPFQPAGKHGCGQDPNNVPRQIGAQRGLEVRDYSCAGSTAYMPGLKTLPMMVDFALGDRALDGNTREVVIQYGFNDSYLFLSGQVLQKGLPQTYFNLQNEYAHQKQLWTDAMNAQIDRIRGAAPNARITIADYPEISEPNTMNQCLVHVPGGPDYAGIPAFWIADAERNISAWAQELAGARGLNFAPVRGATAGHNECTPNGQRIIAGVIDTTTPNYNLPVHMSGPGNTMVAGIISGSMG